MTARWTRRLAEILLLVVIVGGIYAWRTRDMLPAGARVSAPAFELRDLQGRSWTLDALAGRPAVLYFFAPWCRVCAASAPQLRWFQRWMGDEVRVVLVGLDWSSPQQLAAYAAGHRLTLPVLAGSAQTGVDFAIRGYPTYYVLDAEGRIVRRDFGLTTAPGLWLRTRGL